MEDIPNGSFYSGTSGLVLPVPNKQAFPVAFQDKSRLVYYASLFNSIEINSSFYKVPMASTVRNWANDVPEMFRFTFKLWRGITHNKGLVFNEEDVTNFIKIISEAGDKSGCLLIQFPPSLKIGSISQFEKLLISINAADPTSLWKLAVEFRDRSWYEDDIYDLLHEHGAALVIQDMPASASPVREPAEGFAYLRFHGPGGSYRGTYSDDFLYEYAQIIREWTQEGISVFTYFNNTAGEAVSNLRDLNEHVHQFAGF